MCIKIDSPWKDSQTVKKMKLIIYLGVSFQNIWLLAVDIDYTVTKKNNKWWNLMEFHLLADT